MDAVKPIAYLCIPPSLPSFLPSFFLSCRSAPFQTLYFRGCDPNVCGNATCNNATASLEKMRYCLCQSLLSDCYVTHNGTEWDKYVNYFNQ
jgi:hypothetical protein